MPQRQLRLGDTVDDYCPRERRITDHAVVAMIEDQVRQTRCTTCEAEHVYKAAQVPAARMKKAQLKPPQDARPPDTPARVEDARATAGAVPASAPIPETGDGEAEGTDPTRGSRPDAAATGEEGAQVPDGLSGVDGPVRRPSFERPCHDSTLSCRCVRLRHSRFVRPLDAPTGFATVSRAATSTRTDTGATTVENGPLVQEVLAILMPVRLGTAVKRTGGPCCCRITPNVARPTDLSLVRGKPIRLSLPATGRSVPDNPLP